MSGNYPQKRVKFTRNSLMKEREIQDQPGLVTKLAITCQMLALSMPVMPEGFCWHVKEPRYEPPSIALDGVNISPMLYVLAQRSTDLFVNLHMLPEDYDGGDYRPPCYVWEIYPPRTGGKFLGKTYYDCYRNGNMQGLGFTLFCPQLRRNPSPMELANFQRDGALNVDLLSWFEEGEEFYDPTKPESVMLNMIEHRHKTTSLKIALWILYSLRGAQDIHPERRQFQIWP